MTLASNGAFTRFKAMPNSQGINRAKSDPVAKVMAKFARHLFRRFCFSVAVQP